MNKHLNQTMTIQVTRGHHEDVTVGAASGRQWVAEPPTSHAILIQIDMERLALLLGTKAVKSKTGISRALGGIIRVEDESR